MWLQTIVEINNNGTVPLYLNTSSYDLEDAEGNLVAAQSLVSCYPEVIDPGEKGYMYEDTTLDGGTGGQSYTVIPHLEVSTAVLSESDLVCQTLPYLTDVYVRSKFFRQSRKHPQYTAHELCFMLWLFFMTRKQAYRLSCINVLTDEYSSG